MIYYTMIVGVSFMEISTFGIDITIKCRKLLEIYCRIKIKHYLCITKVSQSNTKDMNAAILKDIAKRKGINLNYYGKVRAFINDNYTKLFIIFYDEEGVGTHRIICNKRIETMSVSAILKREEMPEDYETNGGEWIMDIINRAA